MAKRKASRATGRKKTARKTAARKRTRTAQARKAAPRRKRAVARKTAPRRRKAPARQAKARKTEPKRKAARKAASRRRVTAVKQARSTGASLPRASSRGKAPALDRERRVVREDDLVPTPPSSLDMDRSASSARTGRRELHERFTEHTDTSPAITGGDIDADWESASTVGDEAPGGDNPTPDQDIVDDIGRAVGLQYEDNEELKGEKKVADRDKKRWELDPASSEDYNDR